MIATTHAIERFRERAKSSKSDKEIEEKLNNFIDNGKLITPNPVWKTQQLIKYDFEAAKYYFFNGWILVVANDIILTIFQSKINHKFKTSSLKRKKKRNTTWKI